MKRIGTQLELSEDERSWLMSELTKWHRLVNEDLALSTRDEYEKAFDCVWEGQNSKGVKMDTAGKTAWPFEGSSDQRLRWGDKIYQDLKALVMIAITTCEVEVTCGGDANGIERSRAIKMLLNGIMNSLGAKGQGEILTMLRYMLVDTPAVAALDVSWKNRSNIGVRQADIESLQAEYAAQAAAMGAAETDAAASFRLVISGQETDANAVESVESWLIAQKGVMREDVSAVIRALAEDGEVEYRTVVARDEGPELKALRYGEDFCIPTITDDFDYASPWFRGEWVTESQLRERISEDGWDRQWVEETLEHKGIDLFNENGTVQLEDLQEMCCLVWCYSAETNDAGQTTRYVSVISHADGSAFGKRVLRSRRGKWNAAFFRREVRNGNILNARGLAQICAPVQGTAKIVRDMAANNAIVGSLPPIKAQGSRLRNAVVEPFALIEMASSDNITFMQPPAYPAAAKETEEKLYSELLDYVGVANGDKDVTERRREFVSWMLSQWRDLLVLLVEVAQDNASDEYIARVTGSGDAKGIKSEDVSGPFQISIRLDPTNLDNGKLIEKVNAAAQVLQSMDRKGTVDTDPFVRHFFTMLFPEMANSALRTPDQITGDEIKDEQNNFVLIKSGVMPTMDTDGKWNYAARLQFYQDLQQNNPDAIADMTPGSQEMLQRWISALEQQNTQYGENAQIGKTGVQGVGAQ